MLRIFWPTVLDRMDRVYPGLASLLIHLFLAAGVSIWVKHHAATSIEFRGGAKADRRVTIRGEWVKGAAAGGLGQATSSAQALTRFAHASGARRFRGPRGGEASASRHPPSAQNLSAPSSAPTGLTDPVLQRIRARLDEAIGRPETSLKLRSDARMELTFKVSGEGGERIDEIRLAQSSGVIGLDREVLDRARMIESRASEGQSVDGVDRVGRASRASNDPFVWVTLAIEFRVEP